MGEVPNLLFAHFVYGLRLGRSPLALLVVAAAVVFSMACFAVIVAGLARTREQAIPVGMSVVFLSGRARRTMVAVLPSTGMDANYRARRDDHVVDVRDPGRDVSDRSLAQVSGKIAFLLAYGIVSFIVGMNLFSYGQGRHE